MRLIIDYFGYLKTFNYYVFGIPTFLYNMLQEYEARSRFDFSNNYENITFPPSFEDFIGFCVYLSDHLFD